MKKLLFYLSFFALLPFFIACTSRKANLTDDLISHIDSTIKPGDDFFLFANGKWFKSNPIPASEANNGLWQIVQDTINSQILQICKSYAAINNAEKGSNKQKIGDFYFTGMDSITLNKRGISDLKSDLNKIDEIKDIKDICKITAYLHTLGANPSFSFVVGQDDKISNKNAVFISQGGLSLPNRSYYFDTDSRAVSIRGKFLVHIINIFKIMGYAETDAKVAAKHLMELETSIASVSRKLEDTRDPIKNYNKISFKHITELTPNIEWNIFMNGAGLNSVDSVIIGQPEFLKALNSYIKTYSINDWKNYLKFKLLNSFSSFMDDKTFMESFSFYSVALYGVKEPKPRWKRVVEQTDNLLGELIGQVYVHDYLPKGTKEKLLEIGNSIKTVYTERINALDWMSGATKKKALGKLNALIMKVGYPDKWKNLSSLNIDRSSYVQNVMNASKWMFNYMVSKYGKPVDRTEWVMEPQTYNAYYKTSNNEIVIPGCNIIVPGYEHKLADDALLYAIIGATFGHETTHGFDDQEANTTNRETSTIGGQRMTA